MTRTGDLEIGVVVYPGELACVRELMTNNMRRSTCSKSTRMLCIKEANC